MRSKHFWLTVVLFQLVILCTRVPSIPAAEKLVGLQSAPSIAMAVPWFAEEARLYPKYDLDFQLVDIASSGIVTAAMSGGNGSVALALINIPRFFGGTVISSGPTVSQSKDTSEIKFILISSFNKGVTKSRLLP